MKTKYILTALALPAIFMACTNDDLLTEKTSVEGVKGELVELGENFTLGLNRDNNDAETRAAWENTGKSLKFFWYPTENGAWNANAVDKVGLCWYGTDGDKTYATSNGEVYTNYQFNHFGWKLLGTEYDGSDNTTYALVGTATSAGDVELGSGSGATQADYTLENYSTDNANIGKWDGSLGLFNTENKSIFKGEYIVYTPYQEIKNIGHIPASVAAVQQQSNTAADSLKNVGAYTVSYGKASVEGGVETSGLSMRNLTSIVRISVSNETGDNIKLKKVILLDKQSKGFYTKKYLSATKIFANPAATDVYQDALFTGEETIAANSISVNFVSAIDNTADGSAADLTIANGGKATACLVTLPTTIADMAVVLVNDAGKAKIVDVKDFIIGRGQSPKQAISIKNASEFDTSIVTSESEWNTAIGANTAKIVVLGEVPIASAQNLSSISNKIAVSYIGKESGLIFNNTFAMASDSKTLLFDCVTAFNQGITVTAGTLSLNNSTIEGTVSVGDSLVIAGEATYQNGTMTTTAGAVVSVAGSLDVLGASEPKTAGQIQHENGTFVIAANGELTNAGTIVNKAQFTNNGTVNNNASFYNQNKLTNNSETGFVNNADFYDQIGSQFNAYSTVSGAGNYFCDVQSDASNTRLGVAVGILNAQTNQSKKIIRFTDTTAAEYDLKNVTDDIDIIVVASGQTITLNNSNTTAAKLIKSLTVNAGIAAIGESQKFNMNSLEIVGGATATFGNNSITNVKSPVVNNGTFTVTAAATGKLAGIVYCPAPVDASKGTWTGFVTYKSTFDF